MKIMKNKKILFAITVGLLVMQGEIKSETSTEKPKTDASTQDWLKDTQEKAQEVVKQAQIKTKEIWNRSEDMAQEWIKQGEAKAHDLVQDAKHQINNWMKNDEVKK